jgi:5-methylcytosine-specific restriction endonuclease McrA
MDIYHPIYDAVSDQPSQTVIDVHRRLSTFDQRPRSKKWRGLPAGLRSLIFLRDGNCCKKCGAVDDLTIDHILPKSRGGGHDPSNLQTLCRKCNELKANLLPWD